MLIMMLETSGDLLLGQDEVWLATTAAGGSVWPLDKLKPTEADQVLRKFPGSMRNGIGRSYATSRLAHDGCQMVSVNMCACLG